MVGGILEIVFERIQRIPPLRLLLFVLAIGFIAKNYMYSTVERVKPPLPDNHEQMMQEQSAKNNERVMQTLKISAVILVLYLIMLFINLRAENKEMEEKNQREENAECVDVEESNDEDEKEEEKETQVHNRGNKKSKKSKKSKN